MTFARRNPFPPKLRDQPLPAEIPRLTNPGAFTRCDSMTMTIEKNPSTRNTHLRNLARGEECTGRLYGSYCNCDPATTVLAHTNSLSDNKGMGYKGDDSAGMFLGLNCHTWLDQGKATAEEKAAFTAAAQGRTRERWAQIAADPMAKPWRRMAASWALDQLKEMT